MKLFLKIFYTTKNYRFNEKKKFIFLENTKTTKFYYFLSLFQRVKTVVKSGFCIVIHKQYFLFSLNLHFSGVEDF